MAEVVTNQLGVLAPATQAAGNPTTMVFHVHPPANQALAEPSLRLAGAPTVAALHG